MLLAAGFAFLLFYVLFDEIRIRRVKRKYRKFAFIYKDKTYILGDARVSLTQKKKNDCNGKVYFIKFKQDEAELTFKAEFYDSLSGFKVTYYSINNMLEVYNELLQYRFPPMFC
jgi:hypothetical protein